MSPRHDDMHLVLAEIVALMEAQGAAISLYPVDGGAPILVHATDGPSGMSEEPLRYLRDAGVDQFADQQPASFGWTQGQNSGSRHDILMLPVKPVADHNHLMISLLFEELTEQRKTAAEKMYETRRPLALGYFRLWQLERINARRVAALEAACDATDLGIMLFTRMRKLIYANAAARQLLEAGDGLRRSEDSIQATDINDSVKLQVALNHVIAGNAADIGGPSNRLAPLVRLRRKRGKPLIALLVPTEAYAVEPSDVAAMLYVFDPIMDTERLMKPVCKIFQLSPVEARLACLLAAGHSLTKSAEALRIKEQTARSYLKNIFVKTDTKRQTELVHLLFANTVRIGSAITPEPF